MKLRINPTLYLEKFHMLLHDCRHMKKVILITLMLTIAITALLYAGSERLKVPRVAYLEPDNDSIVDLTSKTSLIFRWKQQPLPGGGRQSYRFRVYKGFSYEVVAGEEFKPDVFSVEIPADKFEDGALYSWHVQQRDDKNMLWSLYDTWSFKVVKKK